MDDKLRFESKLTEEEVQKNFEGMDFFSEVMSGLEEALDHAKGKTRSTTMIRKRSLPKKSIESDTEKFCLYSRCFLQNSGSMGSRQKQSLTDSAKSDFSDQPGP